jgi:hypothetical protein
MEPITFALGAVTAKTIFRIWARDTAFENLLEDTSTLIDRTFTDRWKSRNVKRQFESLADDFARRYEPFLSVEIKGVDEGEKAAAISAASKTVENALIDSEKLLALDLDPNKLAYYFAEVGREVLPTFALSEAGLALFSLLLPEAAAYIVTASAELPGMHTAEIGELLARDTKIIDLVQDVLSRLPPASLPAIWGAGSDLNRFESQYLRAVANHTSSVQLYGIPVAAAKRSYSLSVAYIALSVEQESEPGDESRDQQIDDVPDANGGEPTNVEEAVGHKSKLLVNGDAGSGKTTFLQWIALNAATSSFAETMYDWNHKVPFLIRLRQFVDQPLPKPEQFVGLIAPSISGAMPQNWVHKIFADGRGIVLVDGLDEIPESNRDSARIWLNDIISTFPENKYIVTCRTTALPSDWKEYSEFNRLRLLPMDDADIDTFISHWHQAAGESLPHGDAARIAMTKSSLQRIIKDRPAIKSLCTSPLLCALSCALHSERAGQLPTNRMDIYKTALEMLVGQRDEARHIQAGRPANLGTNESILLLQAFAMWMHENGRSDAERHEYSTRIRLKMEVLHHLKSNPTSVADYLLERSGVLREPIAGRVDFVHRTFLEYLAAAAIIDDESVDKLVIHAHEDHWREVVLLAAGHAHSKTREALIRGIINRGRDEPENTHRLFVLAVSCMEIARELSVELQRELAECVSAVIPPHNISEAVALASAGSMAIPMLATYRGKALEVAACVRSLSLIGGEEAMDAIRNFRDDNRLTVIRELIRAWSGFDEVSYAREILANSRLDNFSMTVASVAQVNLLPNLQKLRRVEMNFSRHVVDLEALNEVGLPSSLAMNQRQPIRNLRILSKFPLLEHLTALGNVFLKSTEGVAELPSLRSMDLTGSVSLEDTTDLDRCEQLTRLDLSGTAIQRVDLSSNRQLSQLRLSRCLHLQEITGIIAAARVSINLCPALKGLDALASSVAIKQLFFLNAEHESCEVGLPPNLTELTTSGVLLPLLTGAETLRVLHIHGAGDIGRLAEATLKRSSIRVLRLYGVSASQDLRALAKLSTHTNLRTIHIGGIRGIEPPSISGFRVSDHRRSAWLRYERD